MIIVNGNIVRDAETKLVTGKNGAKTTVTEFTVAENIGFGDNQVTTYYKVSIWRDHGANLCPHLTKGRNVYLVAQVIEASPYVRSTDGQLAASLQLSRVVEIKLNGKKPTTEDDFVGEEVDG